MNMTAVFHGGHWTGAKRTRTLTRHRNHGLELVLVLNGTATWDYEGRRVVVPARHVSFTWPWQWHRAANDAVGTAELYWVILPFRRIPRRPGRGMVLHPALGLTRAENRRLMDRLRTVRTPVFKASPLFCQTMARAVETLDGTGGRPELPARALLLSLLAELLALPERAAPARGPGARARVGAFLSELADRCEEDWPLERLARACGMGRTHVTRWIKELTGDTPVQYLNRQRIARAERLLADPARSVTEVALACGFETSQYFATVFRAFTGRAPSAPVPPTHPANSRPRS